MTIITGGGGPWGGGSWAGGCSLGPSKGAAHEQFGLQNKL